MELRMENTKAILNPAIHSLCLCLRSSLATLKNSSVALSSSKSEGEDEGESVS